MNDEDILFLEETLETLPTIYDNLIKLSNKSDSINEFKQIINQFISNTKQNQIIEIKILLERINSLSSSYQKAQTSTQKSELTKKIWQIYTDFKQFLLLYFNQSNSSITAILTKGESLVGLISPLTKISDLDLFQEIWEQDLIPILNYLETALDNCEEEQLIPIFQQQIETLLGLGELLELTDLIIITQAAIALQQSYPQATHLITKRIIVFWRTAQNAYWQLLASTPQLEENSQIEIFESPTAIAQVLPEKTSRQNQAQPSTINTNNYLLWLTQLNLFLIEAAKIQEIVNLSSEQIIQSDNQIFFSWHSQLITFVRLSQLIKYNYPFQKLKQDSILTSSLSQIVIIQHHQKLLAIQIEVEQLLVIPQLILQPFNPILATPSYLLGCTILENKSLVSVIDVVNLIT